MGRYDIEKQKWDRKTSDMSDDKKNTIDNYDDIFLSMNTLRPIHSFFSLQAKEAILLDIGCGAGWTTVLLAQKAKHVYAIDISSNSIEKLKRLMKKHSLTNITPLTGDVESLAFEDGFFDCVFGSAILHHLILDKVVPEISRVLKKGGKAAFCEPYAHNPLFNLYRYIRHNFIEEFKGTDKPLTCSDKALFEKHFSTVNFIESSLLSDKVPALRSFEAALLDKLPIAGRLASYITITLEK